MLPYRIINADGRLVGSMGSETCDMDVVTRCFSHTLDVVDSTPATVPTDGHDTSPRTTRETPVLEMSLRCGQSTNVRRKREYRVIRQRSSFMRCFGAVASATSFCTAHAEPRDHWRFHQQLNETVSHTASENCSLSAGTPRVH